MVGRPGNMKFGGTMARLIARGSG